MRAARRWWISGAALAAAIATTPGCDDAAVIDQAREQRSELEAVREAELARERRERARAAAEEVAREASATAPPATATPTPTSDTAPPTTEPEAPGGNP